MEIRCAVWHRKRVQWTDSWDYTLPSLFSLILNISRCVKCAAGFPLLIFIANFTPKIYFNEIQIFQILNASTWQGTGRVQINYRTQNCLVLSRHARLKVGLICCFCLKWEANADVMLKAFDKSCLQITSTKWDGSINYLLLIYGSIE